MLHSTSTQSSQPLPTPSLALQIHLPAMTGRVAPNPSSVYNGQRLPGKGEQLVGGCTCGVLLGDLSRELGRSALLLDQPIAAVLYRPLGRDTSQGASLDSLDDSRRNAWYRYGLDKVLGRHRSMSEPPPIRLAFATGWNFSAGCVFLPLLGHLLLTNLSPSVGSFVELIYISSNPLAIS
jgi:hypothetical protein